MAVFRKKMRPELSLAFKAPLNWASSKVLAVAVGVFFALVSAANVKGWLETRGFERNAVQIEADIVYRSDVIKSGRRHRFYRIAYQFELGGKQVQHKKKWRLSGLNEAPPPVGETIRVAAFIGGNAEAKSRIVDKRLQMIAPPNWAALVLAIVSAFAAISMWGYAYRLRRKDSQAPTR